MEAASRRSTPPRGLWLMTNVLRSPLFLKGGKETGEMTTGNSHAFILKDDSGQKGKKKCRIISSASPIICAALPDTTA